MFLSIVTLFRCQTGLASPPFNARFDFEARDTPYSVAIGGLDGDDVLDLAVANGGGNNVSVLINLLYRFSGFLPPVSLESPFTLGSVVPVKFQLTDDNGNYITIASATLTLQQYVGEEPVGDPIVPAFPGAANTGNVFRYDLRTNQYIYNLDTKDLQKGTCLVTIVLDDGQEHTTFISLR